MIPDDEIRKYEDDDPDRDVYDENGNISQETFYSSDEEGYWEGEVIFDEDGRALDSDGEVIRSEEDEDYDFYREDTEYDDDDDEEELDFTDDDNLS